MMLYVLGVSAACFLVLTVTRSLQEIPDAERAASIYLSVACLAGVVAWAAERSARAQERRDAAGEREQDEDHGSRAEDRRQLVQRARS